GLAAIGASAQAVAARITTSPRSAQLVRLSTPDGKGFAIRSARSASPPEPAGTVPTASVQTVWVAVPGAQCQPGEEAFASNVVAGGIGSVSVTFGASWVPVFSQRKRQRSSWPGWVPEAGSSRFVSFRLGATPSSGVESVAALFEGSASEPFAASSTIRTVFVRLETPAGKWAAARIANVAVWPKAVPPPSRVPRASEQPVPAGLRSGHDQPGVDPLAS